MGVQHGDSGMEYNKVIMGWEYKVIVGWEYNKAIVGWE